MTQRRRMSRAQVERTPGREVLRGPRADVLIIDDPWTPTTPPVDREAVEAWWGDTRPPGPVSAGTWQSAPDAWVRRAAVERRAVERTGRALVAWLIGRWRR